MQVQQVADGASMASALDGFRRLLDALPAGAYVCDADGRIAHYTAKAAALWGRAPDLAATDAPRYCGSWRLYGPDGEPIAHDRCWMARALAERTPFHGMRIQIERPDGERRMALAYATPVLDDDGALQGGLNLLVDVTDEQAGSRARAERLRRREEMRIALACDIRAALGPLRRSAKALSARPTAQGHDTGEALDHQLRHVTGLVDRLLNLEVDTDDVPA